MDRCTSVEREQQIEGVASYDRIRFPPSGCPAHAFGHSSHEPLISGVRGLQLQGLPKSSQPLEDRVWMANGRESGDRGQQVCNAVGCHLRGERWTQTYRELSVDPVDDRVVGDFA